MRKKYENEKEKSAKRKCARARQGTSESVREKKIANKVDEHFKSNQFNKHKTTTTTITTNCLLLNVFNSQKISQIEYKIYCK